MKCSKILLPTYGVHVQEKINLGMRMWAKSIILQLNIKIFLCNLQPQQIFHWLVFVIQKSYLYGAS